MLADGGASRYAAGMPARNAASALALLFVACAADAAAAPNVVLIYTDDQRADTLSAYGNTEIRTPNLDRLAGEGFNFRRNYCMGAYNGAVCVPSRAMLLTGRQLFNVSEKLNEDEPLMPRVFSDAGYDTFMTGKWHNGYGPDAVRAITRAFDNGAAIYLGGMANHLQVPLVDLVDGSVENRRIGDGYSTDLFEQAAIDFLNSRAESDTAEQKPFFLYVATTAPHDPRQPPEGYGDRFADAPPSLPPNFLPQHEFDNGSLVLRDENLAAWPRDPDVVREQLGQYYAMIEHLDAAIGRIVETARRVGGEDTIIVYAADHGLALGSHGLLGKQSVYEHSLRSPMIFAGPSVVSGETNELTYLYDIFPTLCSLCGVEAPNGVDGLSLAPLLEGESIAGRDAILLTHKANQKAIVEQDWKLIRYPKVDHTQLFHLASDAHETTNLADDPAHADRVRAMLARLQVLQAAVGDESPLTVESPKPLRRDLTGTPRKADQWQPQWIVDRYFEADEQD